MAERRVWIGSEGPFIFDDEDLYEDGVNHVGLRAETVVEVNNVITSDLTDNVRLIHSDSDKKIQEVNDLTQFIQAGDGISVIDNGDGTVTIQNLGIIRESFQEESIVLDDDVSEVVIAAPVIEQYDEPLAITDDVLESIDGVDTVLENYDEPFAITDDQSEAFDLPNTISESHDEPISVSEDTDENTSMPAPITENHDEAIGFTGSQDESVNTYETITEAPNESISFLEDVTELTSEMPTGDMIHEWDSNGIVLGAGTNIASWNDNIDLVDLTPEAGSPTWNSTEQQVEFGGWTYNLYTDVLDIDTDEFMIALVVDYGNHDDFRHTMSMSAQASGLDHTQEGGIELETTTLRRNVPRFIASRAGTALQKNDYHMQHYGTWAVLCIRVTSATGQVVIDNGINRMLSDYDTVPTAAVNSNRLVLNGRASDLVGGAITNMKAVRVWSTPGTEAERDARIQGMLDDYLADLWPTAGAHPVTIRLFDSYGDGWQGAEMVITDSSDNVVFNGTVTTDYTNVNSSPDGSELIVTDWPLNDETYTVTVSADDFPSEVSWEIEVGGTVVLSGGDDETHTFNPAN